jgi:hypothetical protein
LPKNDLSTLPSIRAWNDVDLDTFQNEIVPAGQPALLKGHVSDWPIVAKGLDSPQALCDYIGNFGRDVNVHAFFAKPDIKGRYFYSDDMRGFNFERKELPLGDLLDQLLEHIDDEEPPCISAGGIELKDKLAALLHDN